MSPASRAAVAVAVLLLPCVGALAEEPPSWIEPGARLRVTFPCEPGPPPATGAPEPAWTVRNLDRRTASRESASTIKTVKGTCDPLTDVSRAR